MLELLDVWKVYSGRGVEYPAVRGVSMSIGRGEFVALVGPSGSGKTTLLNLIGTLDLPSRGDIILNGVSYLSASEHELVNIRRRQIGFVFQTFNLVPYLTALENVTLPMIPLGIDSEERRKKAKLLLQNVNMLDKADKKPNELSGGEQQRVAIARALANDPSIILADEPTGNLDSRNAMEIADQFKKLNEEQGRTIVLVTHNLEVARYAKRIIHLRDGRIEREEVRQA